MIDSDFDEIFWELKPPLLAKFLGDKRALLEALVKILQGRVTTAALTIDRVDLVVCSHGSQNPYRDLYIRYKERSTGTIACLQGEKLVLFGPGAREVIELLETIGNKLTRGGKSSAGG